MEIHTSSNRPNRIRLRLSTLGNLSYFAVVVDGTTLRRVEVQTLVVPKHQDR